MNDGEPDNGGGREGDDRAHVHGVVTHLAQLPRPLALLSLEALRAVGSAGGFGTLSRYLAEETDRVLRTLRRGP